MPYTLFIDSIIVSFNFFRICGRVCKIIEMDRDNFPRFEYRIATKSNNDVDLQEETGSSDKLELNFHGAISDIKKLMLLLGYMAKIINLIKYQKYIPAAIGSRNISVLLLMIYDYSCTYLRSYKIINNCNYTIPTSR